MLYKYDELIQIGSWQLKLYIPTILWVKYNMQFVEATVHMLCLLSIDVV